MAELLIDAQPLINLHLESSDSPGKIMIRGQFARSDRATENKRLYRESLWRREFGRLSESLSNRRMFGELDHPADGRTKLSRVSHIITRLDIKGDEVIGEAEVLDTPNGRIMKALAAANAQVGVSSRGFGSTKTLSDGTLEVQEDFRLDTFDFVADPATRTAYPKVFAEERERMFKGDDMTLEDLKRNYPGLVGEMSKNILAESGGHNLARVITETEERTTQRLTEQFGVQLRRATEILEDEVSAQVRSELMSDPSVAGAKLVIEQIVGLVKSYGMDPEAREDLSKKDEEISGLQRRLADRELEAQKLSAEAVELRKLSKEAAYRLHLERMIGGDKAKETIEALLGDVTAFSSAEDITRRVEAVKSELDKRGVYKEEASKKDSEIAEMSAKLSSAESETARLRARVEELESSKKTARERANTAETHARKAIEVAEGLELQLYVEKKLVKLTEENRGSVRSLCESATDQDEVDRILANFKPQRRLDEDEAQRIRSRVGKGKVRDLNEDTNGPSGDGGKSGRGNPLTEIGLGSMDDFSRLSGARGRAGHASKS